MSGKAPPAGDMPGGCDGCLLYQHRTQCNLLYASLPLALRASSPPGLEPSGLFVPTAMPVHARRSTSCHARDTARVKSTGVWPTRTSSASRRTRESAGGADGGPKREAVGAPLLTRVATRLPVRRAVTEPLKKKAIETQGTRTASRSWSDRPRSRAAAVRLGARMFWSALRNADATHSTTIDKVTIAQRSEIGRGIWGVNWRQNKDYERKTGNLGTLGYPRASPGALVRALVALAPNQGL